MPGGNKKGHTRLNKLPTENLSTCDLYRINKKSLCSYLELNWKNYFALILFEINTTRGVL